MTGMTIAERTKLCALIGRRVLRQVFSSANPHTRLRRRFGRGKKDRLVIAPQDIRTADITFASEIQAGRFAFAGKVVICDHRSPFQITPPSNEWAIMLLNFSWLRHLRAADSVVARANSHAFVEDWITLHGRWHS